jgi:hypothetical protein
MAGTVSRAVLAGAVDPGRVGASLGRHNPWHIRLELQPLVAALVGGGGPEEVVGHRTAYASVAVLECSRCGSRSPVSDAERGEKEKREDGAQYEANCWDHPPCDG